MRDDEASGTPSPMSLASFEMVSLLDPRCNDWQSYLLMAIVLSCPESYGEELQ
ncbi:hypothetical protein MANES_10G027150v8 [Manihot esculenta]|uniref:Uncharacterized protein n=1 Tax=Manihot esculenta TaxID=3983 RepID=A0ACB7GXU4_MANES|nr:hypothetical protein MANES_10G027150v8 [Manihot esculenta]